MSTSEYEWLVIAGGFVCFSMAWGIGANDVANAFATSVGARAISLKQATIIAGIFEFAGAFLLGTAVTDTVRKGITDYAEFEGQADILMLGMFCALCSSSLWLYLATKYSMPVSTTQSIVGSIIGFAVVVHGKDAVDWDAVVNIVLFWIFLPVGSAIIALIFFLPTRQFVLRRDNAYEVLLKIWPLYVFIVVFIMTLFLLFKAFKRIDYSPDWPEALWIAAVCGIGVSAIGYLLLVKSGLLDKYVTKMVKEDKKWEDERALVYKKYQIEKKSKQLQSQSQTEKQSNDMKSPQSVGNMSTIDTPVAQSGVIVELTDNNNNNNNNSNNNNVSNTIDDMDAEVSHASRMSLIASRITHGVNVDVHDDLEKYELEIQANAEEFDPRCERAFNWLQVTSATLDIFAHGSNDVANAVAPFAAIVALYEDADVTAKVHIPWWVAFIGAVGMVVGLSTYGYKIIKAIGVRLVSMSSSRGYSIELSSALAVIIASYYGYPASTTHCQIGATFGIGCLELARSDSKLKASQVVNWKLLAIVFLGWILTVVVSAVTCGLLFAFMAYSPCV